ncbi:molybdate ABC transporter substrate-binding protein [Methylophaga sp. 41_12_T18]|mgnify:CR=1 FL=1|nr:molybdate ABC transporter substrate-binding protein [Methylophaga sp. 41_12_T18]
MRFVAILLLSFFCLQGYAADVRVAAATNLRYVLPELIEAYKHQTGHQLAVSFAASGALTSQILHDAPFEIFLSANPSYIERLNKADRTEQDSVAYAQGQLALYAANHSKLKLDMNLNSLAVALDNGDLTKIVIANPQHAPYGQAAKLALEQAGVWPAIQTHLLTAESASQAVQFTMSSSVAAGFVPYAHVIQPKLKARGRFIKLDIHLPQHAVLIKGASDAAAQFLTFLQSAQASTILIKHGYLVESDS